MENSSSEPQENTEMNENTGTESDKLDEVLEAIPENFRMVSQIYTDQISLIRRTANQVAKVIQQSKDAGASILFDFSNDPLNDLFLSGEIIELHIRIVDLIVLAAFGQKIDVIEFQEYAKNLVKLYPSYDFIAKAKDSALKDPALRDLEAEWLSGSDFRRVQDFFKGVTLSVEAAATYCGVTIATLPEF